MRVLFRKQFQTRSGIVFLTSVLIGRNYVTVVVNVPCYGFLDGHLLAYGWCAGNLN